jgi:hypothetical protein
MLLLAHIIVRRFPPSNYRHSKQVTVKADGGLQIAHGKTDTVEPMRRRASVFTGRTYPYEP